MPIVWVIYTLAKDIIDKASYFLHMSSRPLSVTHLNYHGSHTKTGCPRLKPTVITNQLVPFSEPLPSNQNAPAAINSKPTLRIVNISGVTGDSPLAIQRMVKRGSVDVITGDWLSQMNLVWNTIIKQKDPDLGYEEGFLSNREIFSMT